jgi:hypothetical protein
LIAQAEKRASLMALGGTYGGQDRGLNRCPIPLAIRKPNLSGRMYLMTPDERRLLELLSSSAGGCTELHLAGQGFTFEQIVSLTRAGFAISMT